MSTPWIFLRGLARSSKHWNSFPETFQKMFPDSAIEVLDLAGNGTEISRSSFCSIEQNVADLRERSELLRKHGSVGLCAISMGAMIALKWAEKNPTDVREMVIMNSSDRVHNSFFERLQPGCYLPFLSMIIDQNALRREEKVLRMTTRMRQDLASLALAHSQIPQTSTRNFFRQLWTASRFQLPTHPPTVPTLILSGKQDALASPVCSERLAQAWKFPLYQHEKAGHDLPLEVPDWICEHIRDWQDFRRSSPGT